MKTNKIVTALGIMLLMTSPTILRSYRLEDSPYSQGPVTHPRLAPRPTALDLESRELDQEGFDKRNTRIEPSDEEIMAGHEFTDAVGEYMNRGWPKIRVSNQPLSAIRRHYNSWATVDREGAAAQFSPKVLE